MLSLSPALKFFLNLNVVQSVSAKRFDNKLHSHGISLNDFLILYHIANEPDDKLRRTDLAEKIGLTPSGVTRILLPLEKAGFVKKEVNARDARVSYVKLSPAGKRILNEAISTAEATAQQILPESRVKKMEDPNKMLTELGGTVI